jgi:ribosomal protein S19
MRRSKWKGNFIDNSILKLSIQNKKQLKIWSRRSVVPAFLIGATVLIYNGKEFIVISKAKKLVQKLTLLEIPIFSQIT